MSDAIPERTDTVLNTILNWSQNRPLWQRDVLRRIVLNGYPDEDALGEILLLCKKEHGDPSVTLTAQPLSKDHLPVDPGAGESVSLLKIANVVGVNQLASGQTLEFEKNGLTIVYGQNGTGKSGYTRILKNACRSRHAGEIMPDVYSAPPTSTASAELSISRGAARAKLSHGRTRTKPPKCFQPLRFLTVRLPPCTFKRKTKSGFDPSVSIFQTISQASARTSRQSLWQKKSHLSRSVTPPLRIRSGPVALRLAKPSPHSATTPTSRLSSLSPRFPRLMSYALPS